MGGFAINELQLMQNCGFGTASAVADDKEHLDCCM
jgi:hypothetical protein